MEECGSKIVKALYLFLRELYTFDIVPEDWKTAYLVPIYKNYSKEDLGNYKPVSVMSLVVQVLGKLTHV